MISRRFSSFQAGSVLWKVAGMLPATAPVGYQPTPKPSPFTVSAPSGESSDCATSECFASRITVDGRSGSPEYASQRHMCSTPCSGVDLDAAIPASLLGAACPR